MSKKLVINPKLYDILDKAPDEEVSRQEYFIEKLREEVEEREKRLGRKLKCMVNTFGCQMNARDSEKILGILEKAGYEEAEDEKHADFVIYNTCTVRENANNKVYGRLGYLGSLKRKNPDMIIALCGCKIGRASCRERV